MSKTVVVVLETVDTSFPAGSPAQGGIVFSLSSGATAQTITAAPYSATFTDVPVGTWTASAQAVDVNGAAVGAAATSAEFTIMDDSVHFAIPQTLTVTIQ
jgi:hypothetical protein